MSTGELKFPCAIILTTHDSAYQVVLNYLSQIIQEEKSGSFSEQDKFSANIYSWNIRTIKIGGDNVNVALETEQVIDSFKPSVILLVGVAEGLKDVQLGDVVVATKVYAYETEKAGQTFQTRPEVINPPNHLVRLARREARKKDWLRRLKESSPSSVSNVVFAPIASSGAIFASTDSNPYNLLRSNYSSS